MTPYAVYPKMMAAAGVTLPKVIARIVEADHDRKADES